MKKKIWIYIFILEIVGCAEPFQTYPVSDPIFDQYINQYTLDKELYAGTSEVSRIVISLKDIKDPYVIGECTLGRSYNIIHIDSDYWFHATTTDTDRLLLIYHEMGHCDLGIHEHDQDYTIMNAYHLSPSRFDYNPDFYLRNLFLR